MAREIPKEDRDAILSVLRQDGGAMTAAAILKALDDTQPLRTLQYRLRQLVEKGLVQQEGKRRSSRYKIADTDQGVGEPNETDAILLSEAGHKAKAYISRPLNARDPVGYDRAFLDSYRPNETRYLDPTLTDALLKVGQQVSGEAPAGTYARQIMSRLLIDLSWNSSRLEGNTYSLLDTRRLIAFGEAAEGKDARDAQMILNHKDAIEFLIENAAEIGFDRFTLLNIHALLANNLLPDPAAPGRLRRIAVAIERSTFHPLEVPQLIEECFDQILTKATQIEDPFEQAFFVLVQLPYLQSFEDVNKRVSRLAANIPLVRLNLVPLSFDDVPSDLYTQAILSVYERKDISLLRDLFDWAYRRSAARYVAIRQSLGEPDPFRFAHREALRQVVSEVIRNRVTRVEVGRFLKAWIDGHIKSADSERFRQVAEEELLSLHEGNFARYQVRPLEFRDWQAVWSNA